MSTTAQITANRTNAQNSTGPKTETGKPTASMNAFRHGLTGTRMMLQPHEQEAYTRMTKAMNREYAPKTESESQMVQKIIDCHTRLNRIAAIENNILNVGLVRYTNPNSTNDEETESMVAQAAAWAAEANTFDKLSRYEGRLSRQLLQYTKELDRIQTARKAAPAEPATQRQPVQTKAATPNSASFCQTPLIHHPPANPEPAAPAAGALN